MTREDVVRLLKDPVAQELLHSTIPARFAYTAVDGSPRVIPIWFHWDGNRFVLATAPNSPKVKALARNRRVALTIDENAYPPKVLLVRGTARTEVIEGIAPEYAASAKRYLGDEQGRSWEQQARSIFSQQARIEIDPEWVKILDFQTRFPKAIEDAVGRGSQRP